MSSAHQDTGPEPAPTLKAERLAEIMAKLHELKHQAELAAKSLCATHDLSAAYHTQSAAAALNEAIEKMQTRHPGAA